MERKIRSGYFEAFRQWLLAEEREPATIEKYLREVRSFAAWLDNDQVTKEQVTKWKEQLVLSGCQPATVNGKLAALNKFFTFLGWQNCRVKYLKIQRRVFRSRERELNREEYTRLLETAKALGRERLELLIETICATGIRVSDTNHL